jgi:hypothetical protein
VPGEPVIATEKIHESQADLLFEPTGIIHVTSKGLASRGWPLTRIRSTFAGGPYATANWPKLWPKTTRASWCSCLLRPFRLKGKTGVTVLMATIRLVHRVIGRWMTSLIGCHRNRREDKRRARPGIVMVVQSFGAELKSHVHFHILVTDGGPAPNTSHLRDQIRLSGSKQMGCYNCLASWLEKQPKCSR